MMNMVTFTNPVTLPLDEMQPDKMTLTHLRPYFECPQGKCMTTCVNCISPVLYILNNNIEEFFLGSED